MKWPAGLAGEGSHSLDSSCSFALRLNLSAPLNIIHFNEMASLDIDLSIVATPEGLMLLNEHLGSHSFVAGDSSASTDDVAVFKKLTEAPNADEYPHIDRWYRHVSSWVRSPPADLPRGKFPVEEEEKEKEDDDDDDDVDLFGDDDEEEDDALEKKKEAMQAEKTKKREAAKSSLVIHIEPASVETDLDEVLRRVKDLEIEGVTWGAASTRIPLAYGIEKLQVSCTILDDLVNTNEITDMIEELGLTEEQKQERRKRQEEDGEYDYDSDDDDEAGLVQSATIVSFNKL